MDSLAKQGFQYNIGTILVDNEFSIIDASLLTDMEWKTEGLARLEYKESIYYFYYIHFSIMGE